MLSSFVENNAASSTSSIYKPVSKFGDKASKSLEVGKVESKLDGVKKPVCLFALTDPFKVIGKKPGTGKRMSNLELFKEELKRWV